MKLWLLKRPEDCCGWDRCGWDEARGFVVRAETEAEARALAAKERGDEPESVWLVDADVTELKAKGSAGVILCDFNAG